MTYEQAISYIHAIDWRGSLLGLTRIRELMSLLGDPQDDMKIVHVAGTNGKGSVCAMLTSVLTSAGYSVGTYVSPGLISFNERIRFNGENLSDDDFVELVSYVSGFAEKMEDKPTEFEFFTAIAFEYFKRKGCDLVILEVGLGGELDSTNIIKTPILSVITSVDLDHTRELGNTIEAIASAKAGIIKKSRPVLYGGENKAAEQAIRKKADDMGSKLYLTDRSKLEIEKSDLDSTVFGYRGEKDYKLKLLGLYQPYNACTVIDAVTILREEGVPISEKALRDGLNKTVWQARFEKLSDDPIIIIDGAHNPHGVKAAVASMKKYFSDKRIILAMGVLADKNHSLMVEMLSETVDEVFAFSPSNSRALGASALEEEFELKGITSQCFESVAEAISAAYAKTAENENNVLVILGSLYLYPEALEAVKKIKNTAE